MQTVHYMAPFWLICGIQNEGPAIYTRKRDYPGAIWHHILFKAYFKVECKKLERLFLILMEL